VAREDRRRRGDQIRLAFAGAQPAGQDDDRPIPHGCDLLEQQPGASGVGGVVGDPGVHHSRLARQHTSERAVHRRADADDQPASSGHDLRQPAVPRKVELQPDHGRATAERRDRRDQRGLDPVGMHDRRPGVGDPPAQPESRRQHRAPPRGGEDRDVVTSLSQALHERAVLQRDDLRRPPAIQAFDDRTHIRLASAELRVRRDEHHGNRGGQRGMACRIRSRCCARRGGARHLRLVDRCFPVRRTVMAEAYERHRRQPLWSPQRVDHAGRRTRRPLSAAPTARASAPRPPVSAGAPAPPDGAPPRARA
jgi:hypothetical protein